MNTVLVLIGGQGFAFGMVRRPGHFSGNAEGGCYVVANLRCDGDAAAGPQDMCWSAPAYFLLNLAASGYTCGAFLMYCLQARSGLR